MSLAELALTLQQLITDGDGIIPFHQSVNLTPFIRLKAFSWQRDDKDSYIKIGLDFQVTPFGGSSGVVSIDTQEKCYTTTILEVLRRVVDIKHCEDCCGLYPTKQLPAGRCAGCHIARTLTPVSHDCSICQLPAERCYTTKCGHHFHFACLTYYVEELQQERRTLPPWITAPLKCPNCRALIDSEFTHYFASTADD